LDKPAVLGGAPAFEALLPITKPTLPKIDAVIDNFQEIFKSGMITNSKYVKRFEEEIENYIGVKHASALSSCTSGLLLVLKAFNLEGEVIIPSFTFSASGHALIWNGLKPKFVDIDNETYNVDVQQVKEAVNSRTSAILGVHIFGNPCDIKALVEIAKDHHIKLIFDAAHALGSKYNNLNIGQFGDAEVFSCSPTKLMVTSEGGIVTTNDDELERKVKIGRNYGDDGSYDCEFAGLNARMSELHAILGMETLKMLDSNVENRSKLANIYMDRLSKLNGIKFQTINPGCRTTFKDFSIYVEEENFGLNRDELSKALSHENIMTRKYFYPPLHQQRAYSKIWKEDPIKLPVTEDISTSVLSLPLFSHMAEEDVIMVSECIEKVHEYAGEIKTQMKSA
jgi:dTDP-4-amino-4,6-dideoxygalactose transaminase